MRDRFYSTAELARVCGVSISTIKRWTDAGLLRCVRTPGGHRKFRLQDVAEATRRLGLAAADAGAVASASVDELALLLLQGNSGGLVTRVATHLRAGDGFAVRRFVLDLHRHGQSLAEAADLLRAGLGEIVAATLDPFVVRRAEQIALAAARDLLLQVPEPSQSTARALVVTASDVPSLHTVLVQIALAERGWQPLDLGVANDDAMIAQGVMAENAALVVLLGSHAARPGLMSLCSAHGVRVLRVAAEAPIATLTASPPTAPIEGVAI